MLYMQWEFKGILRNPLYNNLNFPVKINVRSGVILEVRHKKNGGSDRNIFTAGRVSYFKGI